MSTNKNPLVFKFRKSFLNRRLKVVTLLFLGSISIPQPVFSETQPSRSSQYGFDTAAAESWKTVKTNSHTLHQFHNLIEKDYRTIASQMFHRAVQDYDRWLKLGRPADFHNALFHINSAVDINPDSSEHLFFQGMLYATLKADPVSLTQATDSFLSVLELQPDHRQARFALAQVLQEQGKFQLAAWQYQLLLDAHPEMVTGLVLAPLAFCYLSEENPEAGLKYLKNLSFRHPKSASLRTTLAVLLQNNNRTIEAAKELEQVIQQKLGSKAEQDYARLLQAKWLKGGKR